jgi:hypothetical protein
MDKSKMEQIQMEAMEVRATVTNKIFKIWQWQMDFRVQFKQEET